MSMQDKIAKTGYSETELIYLGLITMKLRMKDARNGAEDSESYEHYDAMVKAYEAMEIHYKAMVDKEAE